MNEKFDPMTGEPLQPQNDGGMRFDPMTGEPLQPQNDGGMRFDPMTGEPLYFQNDGGNFDPMTGRPLKKKKTGKIFVAFGIAAAAVAVLGVGVFAGLKSGVLLSKGDKVLVAVSNTLSDGSHLMETFDIRDILKAKEYTVSVGGTVEGNSVDVSFRNGKSQKQVDGTLGVTGFDETFTAVLTEDQLKAQISMLDDYVFIYNYKEESSGYISEMADGNVLETVNRILETLYSGNDQEDIAREFQKELLDEYHDLDFKKISRERFEVNGKERRCDGYAVTVTSDDMLGFLHSTEDYYQKSLMASFGDLQNIAGGYESDLEIMDGVEEVFDEIENGLSEMDDVDLTFYLYKNKLACIKIDAEGEDVALKFLGGDTRMQNMEIEVDGDTTVEVEGDTSGSLETTEIYAEGSKIFEMEYDYKSGDLTMEAGDDYSDVSLEANVQKKKSGLLVSLGSLEEDDQYIAGNFELSVEKGASFTDLEGEEFDVGEASESDWKGLEEDFAGQMEF